MSPLLDVKGLTIQYKTTERIVTATYQVDFQVYEGERYIILGPSGCGKSTLLKGVGGFLHPVAGDILLKGHKVDRPGPDRVMVFQEFDQLLPWHTVRGNIMFALLQGGRVSSKSEARDIAESFISKVKLDRFADSFPHTLSGGMKQRVAIARGMAMQPDILLMDEPFASLDALTRLQMQEELLELWEANQFTLLFVTHSIDEAIILGSRILILSAHPGQVRAELDASRFSHLNASSPEFGAFKARIHALVTAGLDEEEDVS
ncbi:ABC transporter ATP-binding protein [Rhodophyticola sp. CCM32]|nr:ABC transporter ATP-binding protein [Rhodophyticola sp. CCM32]